VGLVAPPPPPPPRPPPPPPPPRPPPQARAPGRRAGVRSADFERMSYFRTFEIT
jgi:OOP family OmpA-OmpF porin